MIDGIHKGARIVIMGGSDSLDDDMDGLQYDVLISTNGHGFMWNPDYFLAMDDKNSVNGMMFPEYLAMLSPDTPLIGPQRKAHKRLSNWPRYPRRLYSGNMAVWVAAKMGASVIILAGVDGYGASPNYMRQVQHIMPDVNCPIYAVSGNVFPMYVPEVDEDDTTEG